MQFQQLSLPGVWLIDATPHVDERGMLRRHFCAEEFAAHGLCPRVAQGNISENLRQHTLRGLHYQQAPHGEAKTVSCLRGAVYLLVADVREESPTYLRWTAEMITAANRRSIHAPPGCAMAFLTLEDNTIVHYYMSDLFVPGAGRGIRFDDPTFGFRWPVEPLVISAKDRAYPNFVPVRR